jgi:hypothetical protein
MILMRERKGEIAYQVLKVYIRQNVSFRDIASTKRVAGNLLKEPGLVEANISKDEFLEFGKLIYREVFEEQMRL